MGVAKELGSSCHNQKSKVFPVIVEALSPLAMLVYTYKHSIHSQGSGMLS